MSRCPGGARSRSPTRRDARHSVELECDPCLPARAETVEIDDAFVYPIPWINTTLVTASRIVTR